jgi:hypothetical protein
VPPARIFIINPKVQTCVCISIATQLVVHYWERPCT